MTKPMSAETFNAMQDRLKEIFHKNSTGDYGMATTNAILCLMELENYRLQVGTAYNSGFNPLELKLSK